jgi:hypothetical protein
MRKEEGKKVLDKELSCLGGEGDYGYCHFSSDHLILSAVRT